MSSKRKTKEKVHRKCRIKGCTRPPVYGDGTLCDSHKGMGPEKKPATQQNLNDYRLLAERLNRLHERTYNKWEPIRMTLAQMVKLAEKM